MLHDNRLSRLRYRSWHRGTREMDLIMGSFADAHLADFTDAQLAQFEAILDLPDPDLYNWITGQTPVPPEQDGEVIRMLIGHHYVQKSG